jgi:hypothetical protein
MASRDGDSHKSRARQFVEEKRRQAKEEADKRAQAALDRKERADKRGQPKGEKEKEEREETSSPVQISGFGREPGHDPQPFRRGGLPRTPPAAAAGGQQGGAGQRGATALPCGTGLAQAQPTPQGAAAAPLPPADPTGLQPQAVGNPQKGASGKPKAKPAAKVPRAGQAQGRSQSTQRQPPAQGRSRSPLAPTAPPPQPQAPPVPAAIVVAIPQGANQPAAPAAQPAPALAAIAAAADEFLQEFAGDAFQPDFHANEPDVHGPWPAPAQPYGPWPIPGPGGGGAPPPAPGPGGGPPVGPAPVAIMANNRPVKVRPFESGQAADWITWRKYFEGMAAMWEWEDARARRELLTAMDGEAARMTQDIEFRAAGQTADDLLTELEGRFITEAGAKLAQQEFRKARQMPDETVLQFHSRVRTLFTRAYPGVPTEGDGLARLLRDTFIWGLESRKITEYVSDGQPATYQDCLTRAQGKLATLVGFEDEKNKRSSKSGLHAMKGPTEDQPPDSRACHGCGQVGHFVRQCPLLAALRKAQEGGLVSAVRGRGDRGRGRTRGKASDRRPGGRSIGKAKKRVNQIDADHSEDEESRDEAAGNDDRAGL